MPGPAYTYSAAVTRVHDGDTVTASVDLGFGVWLHDQHFRLLGCNAIELADPGGKQARDHLAGLLPPGTAVTLRSVKPDKYARYDAQITLADGTDLVGALVASNWAAAWDGTGARPLPPWPRP